MTASVHATELLLTSVLLQLIVMIGAARLLNGVARRFGQPGVIGEIIASLLLGPSLFGHFFPATEAALFGGPATAPITVISQIGPVLLMFQIGSDFEFAHLRAQRHRAATGWVAAASITVPLLLGFAFGCMSAEMLATGVDPLAYSLCCGVAVAITAVPILGRILREFNLEREPIGVIAISAAAIDDVIGWLLLAAISAYATGQLSGAFMLWRIGALVAGAALLWLVGRPMIDALMRRFAVRDGALPPDLMAIVLCLMFAVGLCTNRIGIFTIFGGFAAGLLFHRHRDFVAAWRRLVDQFVLIFFLPVLFHVHRPADQFARSVLVRRSRLALRRVDRFDPGQGVPVFLAARLCRFAFWQSAVLGQLMNMRALIELIVLNVGFDLGFLPQMVFTMLVIMAVTTTIMTGPLLQVLQPRMGHAVRDRVAA